VTAVGGWMGDPGWMAFPLPAGASARSPAGPGELLSSDRHESVTRVFAALPKGRLSVFGLLLFIVKRSESKAAKRSTSGR
jgi:hypothetical protein